MTTTATIASLNTDTKSLIAILASIEKDARNQITVPIGSIVVSIQASFPPNYGLRIYVSHFAPSTNDKCTQGHGTSVDEAIASLIGQLTEQAFTPDPLAAHTK